MSVYSSQVLLKLFKRYKLSEQAHVYGDAENASDTVQTVSNNL